MMKGVRGRACALCHASKLAVLSPPGWVVDGHLTLPACSPRLRLLTALLDLVHSTLLIAPARVRALLSALFSHEVLPEAPGHVPTCRMLALPPPFDLQRIPVLPRCGLPCRDVRASARVRMYMCVLANVCALVATQVPISPLLSRLDVAPLLQLYSSLLCEGRVIMVSRSASVVTACVYAALALLQPFEWMVRGATCRQQSWLVFDSRPAFVAQHVFIPFVPKAMLPYCCVPAPMIAGVLDADLPQLLKSEVGEVSAPERIPATAASCDPLFCVHQVVVVCLDAGVVVPLNGAQPPVLLATELDLPFHPAVTGARRPPHDPPLGMPPFFSASGCHTHSPAFPPDAFIGEAQRALALRYVRTEQQRTSGDGVGKKMGRFLKHSITASRRAAASSRLGQRLGAAARDALENVGMRGGASSEAPGDRLAREVKDVYARERGLLSTLWCGCKCTVLMCVAVWLHGGDSS